MSEVPLGAPPDNGASQTQTQRPFGVKGGAVGSYRLLEALGEGGMGEVWLAEQTRPMRRHVALKIVKLGMDSAQIVARFEAERQALALMDHPAIAKVFDAGVTPEGRPYFAMEYVRGEALTQYCDRQRLTTEQRLELFLHVCEGVQHAHQKGIIHRDLKPSNILVTVQDDHSVPKIIDFGVAKAVNQPLTEHTLHTSLGGFVGTAEYMSPEQAESGAVDIDTRADVYALGVVLYELLTGVLPFDRHVFQEKNLDEIRRTLRDVDPPRPSTRIALFGPSSTETSSNRRSEPARLASSLRGDLDWITMKALEKERTRRYATANALAMDIRRHLSNEPVLASPPSAVYRARKFVRRHRFGVTAAAAALVLLVGFAAAMAIQTQRVARERDRADREATTATQVSEFLVSLFRVSDPGQARGSSLTAREVLDNGARRIETELAGQPEIQGRLLAVIGDVYANLALYSQAEAVLTRSLEIRGRALGQESLDSAASANKLAAVFGRQGKLAQAEPLIRQALEVRRRVLGAEHPDTVTSLSNMSNLLYSQGNVKEAEMYAREALDIRRRTLGNDAPETLDSLNNVAAIVSHWNQAEAEAYVREAVVRSRRVQGQDHPKTLLFLRHHADLLRETGKYPESELVLRQVLDGQQRVLGTDHVDRLATRGRLGEVLRLQGKLSEAEVELQAVLEHQQSLSLKTLQATLVDLGMTRIAQGRYEEAEKLGRQSLAIETGQSGRLLAMSLLGRSLLNQARFEAAEPFLLESYSEYLRTGGQSKQLQTLELIVDLYKRWPRPDKAAEWRAKLPK